MPQLRLPSVTHLQYAALAQLGDGKRSSRAQDVAERLGMTAGNATEKT